jgi:hypothetical protein
LCEDLLLNDRDAVSRLQHRRMMFDEAAAFMKDRNTRIWSPDADNIQPHMSGAAPGINRNRWDTR